MKLEGHIIAVEDVGGELRITAQAAEATAPEWASLRRVTFQILDRANANRTYYVGRDLTLTVEAK
jgi:TRAP-type mannitol/chloroaromatic compound transport system substrate-binding protein